MGYYIDAKKGECRPLTEWDEDGREERRKA